MKDQSILGIGFIMRYSKQHPYILLGVFIMILLSETAFASAPIGWSVVNSMGIESTIGGGNGDVVTARTIAELEDYASRTEELTILVDGTLTGNGRIDVASNKTILGVGSKATLIHAYLNLNGVSNVIIRNLTIRESVDGIALRQSHHVWIDHCDLSACGDGLLDITHGSDYVTVSWTRFSDHHKTMLINSGTSQPEDAGYLKTTIHHCWYDGSNTRNPRVGYGLVHIFNCLYNGNGYGVGLHSQARVLLEHSYFDAVKDPVKQMYREDPLSPHHGFCEGIDNVFNHCEGQRDLEGISFPVDHYYMYDFLLDDALHVPSDVQEGVGPNEKYGTLNALPVPGDGAVAVRVEPTLRWTRGVNATGYRVAFGDSNPPMNTFETNGQTFNPGELKPGTVYYWRVDQITRDGIVKGDVWRFKTLPAKAWFESPVNHSTEGTASVRLDWRYGAKAIGHRLYIAPANQPLEMAAEIESAPFMMKELKYGTNYRWRVDEVCGDDVVPGDVWEFRTHDRVLAGPGRIEAEDLILSSDYLVESIGDASGGAVAAKNHRKGWMLYSHNGADGNYAINICYFNNKDGVSQFQLYVGDHLISEWLSNEGNDGERFVIKPVSNIEIKNGQDLKVVANWIRGDHLARVDWIETKREVQ